MSSSITLDLTLNDCIRLEPRTLPVLDELGFDTCCGGAVPLGEAARRHGLDPRAVLARVRGETVPDPGPASPAGGCGCGGHG